MNLNYYKSYFKIMQQPTARHFYEIKVVIYVPTIKKILLFMKWLTYPLFKFH